MKFFFFLLFTLTAFVSFVPVADAQQSQSCVGTSCFPMQGKPSDYYWGTYLGHPNDAIDINIINGEDTGRHVYSIWAGTVILSGQGTEGCGYTVIIDHPLENTQTLYCHLKEGSLRVSPGQAVSAGQIIALANNSGTKTTAPHLHLQVGKTSGGQVIGYYTEQQTISIPALAGMKLNPTQQADNGTTGPGSVASQLFLLSGAGEIPQASKVPLKLEIDWPILPGVGISLNDLVEDANPNDGDYKKIYLQNIVNFIFVLSLWIGAVIAFISIIYAGFVYIISGSNPGERGRAISGIKNTLIGIAILLFSVVILNTINPNLTNLQLNITSKTVELVSPNAPTASGGLLKNTTSHSYSPISFTDRTGTEDTYGSLIVRSTAVQDCFTKAKGDSIKEGKCEEAYEREVVERFKSQGAILVKDDDDTQVSCAAVCMQLSNDSLNCRQFGSGQDDDSGGAKMIWNRIRNANGTPRWVPDRNGFYPEDNSASDKWLRNDEGVPGDEDLESRQCVALYVENAADAPGDFTWDACFCNTNPSQR